MSPHSSSGSESSGNESGGSKYKKGKKEKKDKGSKDKDKKDKDKDKKDKDRKDKDKDKDKDHKKDKDKDHKKDKDKDGHKGGIGGITGTSTAAHSEFQTSSAMYRGHDQFSSPPIVPPTFNANSPPAFPQGPPPAFPSTPTGSAAQTPPSGYRVPLTTNSPFPDLQVTGQPPFYDADGVSPIFLGSALFETSVHPCKIGPHLAGYASVAYGGAEHSHQGRFDLLPFVPATMEWVSTSYGRAPPGRQPIEGGYEDGGAKLYHGAGIVSGVRIPGKAGEHLNGCNVAFGGGEVALVEHEILCWR